MLVSWPDMARSRGEDTPTRLLGSTKAEWEEAHPGVTYDAIALVSLGSELDGWV